MKSTLALALGCLMAGMAGCSKPNHDLRFVEFEKGPITITFPNGHRMILGSSPRLPIPKGLR